jgi:hypothetical protein
MNECAQSEEPSQSQDTSWDTLIRRAGENLMSSYCSNTCYEIRILFFVNMPATVIGLVRLLSQDRIQITCRFDRDTLEPYALEVNTMHINSETLDLTSSQLRLPRLLRIISLAGLGEQGWRLVARKQEGTCWTPGGKANLSSFLSAKSNVRCVGRCKSDVTISSCNQPLPNTTTTRILTHRYTY